MRIKVSSNMCSIIPLSQSIQVILFCLAAHPAKTHADGCTDVLKKKKKNLDHHNVQ